MVVAESRSGAARRGSSRPTLIAPWVRLGCPVNIEACEGSVHGASAVARVYTRADLAHWSRLGLVPSP